MRERGKELRDDSHTLSETEGFKMTNQNNITEEVEKALN